MIDPSAPTESANPFARGIKGEYFVGREPELKRFRANLPGLRTRQPNHELVAGLEGTGKSYYLHKLADIAREENFIGLVLTLDANVTPYLQIKPILNEIIEHLQDQAAKKTNKPPSGELKRDWDAGQKSTLFKFPQQDMLVTSNLKNDFRMLSNHARQHGFDGVVICLDEGQRIEPLALSGLKNALEGDGFFQIVLSWRLLTDTGGAAEAGRRALRERATRGEQDQGAERMYGTPTGLGPFTELEVRRFFATRLANKAIRFSDQVCDRLGAITDRTPGWMTDFASKVYDRALTDQILQVDVSILDDCFQERYADDVKRAFDLCAELPKDMKDIVKALCEFDGPKSVVELVERAFPNLQEPFRTGYAEGKGGRLDDISKKSAMIIKNEEGQFVVANNAGRYALKIAMGMT
jgi:hypothetical protein